MNVQTLITNAPAELLLGLGIFAALAALALLALSGEAGNYPELTAFWRRLRHPGLRARRRWYFNTGSASER